MTTTVLLGTTPGRAAAVADGHPAQRRRRPSGPTVAAIAVVIAYADGFWVTSMQGAVGAIERSQHPFARWVRDSTTMLPLVVLAVFGALVLTHRWVGRRGELAQLGAALVLVVVATTALSIGEVIATSAYDYHRQVQHLAVLHGAHDHGGGTAVCSSLCAARRETLHAHERAIETASVVLLATNVVLVGWVLAVRGGRLWGRRRPVPRP